MKRAISLLFFLGGCLLLTIGLAVVGVAFVWRPGDVADAFGWKPPLERVDNRALAQATVFLPLTGMDAANALSNALDEAHLENAFVLIAYDPTLSDPTRLGALLQLGTRYAAAKNTRKAVTCYQAAALLATISPALSDPAREDTYLQVSAGLRALGARDAARWVTDQAYLVAQHSPALRREVRARRLAQVADSYEQLGLTALAVQARTLSSEAASAPSETAVATARAPFSPAAGKLPAAKEVDDALQARIAAARQLSEDVVNVPPKSAADLPQDLLTQLGDALLQEDSARLAYYDQQIVRTQDPAVQIALLRDKAYWLALKYRIARGAFGADLVPEWKQDAAVFADTWGEVWGDLFRLYETQATALPKAQDMTLATEDVIRQELLAARWGWYNIVSETDLRAALEDVNQKLRDASAASLRLDVLTRSGKTMYFLVPDDLYGAGENALPK